MPGAVPELMFVRSDRAPRDSHDEQARIDRVIEDRIARGEPDEQRELRLVQAIRAGDHGAWSGLIDLYQDRIYAERALPMICANPDKVVKFGDQLIFCAGALGDVYEALGGQVILCGKPHAPIYNLARRRAAAAGMKDDARILAIGDGFQTDILGANRQNLDVVYVADGIFSEDSRGKDGKLDPVRVDALLNQYGVSANFSMDGLRW